MKKRGHDKKSRQKSVLRSKRVAWLEAWDMYVYIDADDSLIIPWQVMDYFRHFQDYATMANLLRRIP